MRALAFGVIVLVECIAFACSSCSGDDVQFGASIPYTQFDADLLNYYELFQLESKLHGVDPRLGYGVTSARWDAESAAAYCRETEPGLTTVGCCVVWSDGDRAVYMDPAVLPSGEPVVRALAFHEFGHCVFDLVHTTDVDAVMYPVLDLSAPDWDARWTTAVDGEFDTVRTELHVPAPTTAGSQPTPTNGGN